MTFKCLIVDDEAPARELLKEYVSKIPTLECVGVLSNAIEAKSRLQETPVDILFLDISMPDLTGLDLVKILPNPKPAIILTTAYNEYAVESYQFGVADYLLKPIIFDRFFRAVNKVMDNHPKAIKADEQSALQPMNADLFANAMFVKSNQKIVKILFDQIQYIEGLREYVSIFTTTGRHVVLQSLSRLMEILPSDKFMRVHRSYIINVTCIDAIENNSIIIGKTEIVISKSQKQAFMDIINRDMLF